MNKIFTKTPEEQLEILKSGSCEIISEEDLLFKLKKSYKENIPLRIKCGIDPTGSDIHIGHALPYLNMKMFQDLGHTGVVIIGDYTATIGDPTGKDETRQQKLLDDVKNDGLGFVRQLGKILDLEKTEIRFQSEWFNNYNLNNILSLASKSSVQQLLSHDTFRKRLDSTSSLRLHELFYPLLQGYDSVAIKADVELGDPAQKFNILVGRDLQREFNMPPQVAFLNPILFGLDGKEKMSKSLNNYIGLDDTPTEKFGKLMSISDNMVEHYLVYAGRCSKKDAKNLVEKSAKGEIHPFELKKQMAQLVISIYDSKEEAMDARNNFEKVFSKNQVPDDIITIILDNPNSLIIEIALKHKLVSSKSDFRRLVKQNAVSVNGEKIADPELVFPSESSEFILKIGKRKFLKVLKK